MLNFFKRAGNVYSDNFDTDFKNPMSVFLFSVFFSTTIVIFVLYYWINSNLYSMVADNKALLATSLGSLFVMTSSYMLTQLIHRIKFKRFFEFKGTLGNKERWYKAIKLVLLMIAFQVVFGVILKVLFDDNSDAQIIDMNKFVLSIGVTSLLLFPIIGAFEEFIFRGVLQQSITKGLSKFFNEKFAGYTSIGIVSICFALLHAGQSTLHELITIYFLSFFLGWMYMKYKDLKLNMLVHGLNNLFFVGIVFISSYFSGTSLEYQQKLEQMNTYGLNESVEFVAAQTKESPYQVRYNPFALLDSFCGQGTANNILNNDFKLDKDNCKELDSFKVALERDYALMNKIKEDKINVTGEKGGLDVDDFLGFYDKMIKALN